MGIIFLKQVPNAFEIVGMLSGLIGVLTIILQKKEKLAKAGQNSQEDK